MKNRQLPVPKNFAADAIYVEDDSDLPSESDDEDERLDCVHEIQMQGEDQELQPAQAYDDVLSNSDTNLSTERRAVNDEDMDGDVEDADGMETERRRENSQDSQIKENLQGSDLRMSSGCK